MLSSAALDPRDRGGLAQPLLIARDLKKHFPVKGARGKFVKVFPHEYQRALGEQYLAKVKADKANASRQKEAA